MKKVSLEQIVLDEKNIKFQPEDSVLLSYREFVGYFSNLEEITLHNLIISSYFTFGWMPMKFEFKSQDFSAALDIINKVKLGEIIELEELIFLKGMINNSLVGTSKLLHFTNPHIYAIMDRRVYKYINGDEDTDQLNNPENYLVYLENCNEITQIESFKPIHESMNKKIGYEVTPLRALELVMFMSIGGTT